MLYREEPFIFDPLLANELLAAAITLVWYYLFGYHALWIQGVVGLKDACEKV